MSGGCTGRSQTCLRSILLLSASPIFFISTTNARRLSYLARYSVLVYQLETCASSLSSILFTVLPDQFYECLIAQSITPEGHPRCRLRFALYLWEDANHRMPGLSGSAGKHGGLSRMRRTLLLRTNLSTLTYEPLFFVFAVLSPRRRALGKSPQHSASCARMLGF